MTHTSRKVTERAAKTVYDDSVERSKKATGQGGETRKVYRRRN